MKDLAPYIKRIRLFIEGFYNVKIDRVFVNNFLKELSEKLSMTILIDPVIFKPDNMGIGRHHGLGGYIAWVESGISVYTWDKYNFFTIDLYSCKEINTEDTVEYIVKKLDSREYTYDVFRYED